MDIPFFPSLKAGFRDIVSSPLPFLEGSRDVSNEFRRQCKALYDFYKISQGSKKPDPLPRLILEGFDNEQIWGQIELFNEKEATLCLKATEILLLNEEEITFYQKEEKDPEVDEKDIDEDEQDSEDEELTKFENLNDESESEDGFHFEESDGDEFGEGDDEDNQKGASLEENVETTEVDDDFFSLRKMEKFLDEEDRKFEKERDKPPEGDIDYFEDIPSSDERNFSSDDEQMDIESSYNKSSRHLKYDDYFDAPLLSNQHSKINDKPIGAVENENESIDGSSSKNQSVFQRHREQILKRIEVLEDKALAPADWQLKGEVRGSTRPENSLLQETLQFDHVARPPVEITEEHTKSLEDIIKQRILDEAWDDVERIHKPEGDATEYKKRIVLDSNQSKLTLSDIYEKEYLEKTRKGGKLDEDGKESEEYVAIRKDMKDLFRKLDALSNFHFIAPPPEPEIKLISNVPSIAKEEVQPITHAESQVLAPEEVFAKSTGGEEKSTQEKSSTDKKRERRKKKMRLKARAKARLEKLKALDSESDKVKRLEAVDQLRKAAKAPGSNTTIIHGKDSKSHRKLTSQTFFTKLQEKGTQNNSRKRK